MSKQEYREPDLKAPRFRQESSNIIDADFIKAIKEKHSKYKDLNISTARKIIKTFNETLWKEVVETRDGVQLPEGLGVLFIASCQAPMKESIDYAKSKKYNFVKSHSVQSTWFMFT